MEKITKKQPINTLKEGDRVDDVFVVKIKKGVSPYAKGFSFSLLLSDSTGLSIEYKYWGGTNEGTVRKLYDSIKDDSVVHVQGKFSIWRETRQITTNEPDIIETLENGQYEESDFIKKPKKDIDEMYNELIKFISSVKNEQLKNLLSSVFEDISIKDKFKTHPAGITIHHDWIGGLLQHTLEVAKYCELSAEACPMMDRDLLITGALLHDIGKLEEMEVTTRIKGTRRGQLHGHIVMGSIFISNKMNELKIDEDARDRLLHIIISHHGTHEFGSPEEPMSPEAVAVYYADEMSSKLAEIAEFIEQEKSGTEDDFKMKYPRDGKKIFLR